MSGFYDDDLEFRMTGLKVNRPQTPPKKKVVSVLFRKTFKKLHFMTISIVFTINLLAEI